VRLSTGGPTQPIRPLDSRPLPSPTDYIDRVFASGLIQGLEQGIEREAELSASLSSKQPKQELMTQRIQDPRATKARVDRERKELAIAKRRAQYVRGSG
jgi:hypothetical protein